MAIPHIPLLRFSMNSVRGTYSAKRYRDVLEIGGIRADLREQRSDVDLIHLPAVVVRLVAKQSEDEKRDETTNRNCSCKPKGPCNKSNRKLETKYQGFSRKRRPDQTTVMHTM